MVTAIRIYIEGDPALRQGFGQFLDRIRSMAREKRIRWDIILCGDRNSSLDAFKTALETHPTAFNMLLVDAEGPVSKAPWSHLNDRDRWDKPKAVGDEGCHLMTQAMEAWFVADLSALETFYGKGFNEKALPRPKNVEEIDRKDLLDALVQAARNTTKGGYHKVRHGEKILAYLNETTVRKRAYHCDRLFKTLEDLINPSSAAEEPAADNKPVSEAGMQTQSPLSEKLENREHE